jgi:hypothetical protein
MFGALIDRLVGGRKNLPMEVIEVLPDDLRARSLSNRDIILAYDDALAAIDHLLAHRWAILGWRGWIRFPDGRIDSSLRHQGTSPILREKTESWDEYMQGSAAFCRETMRIDQNGEQRRPEIAAGTLYFGLDAMSEEEGSA